MACEGQGAGSLLMPVIPSVKQVSKHYRNCPLGSSNGRIMHNVRNNACFFTQWAFCKKLLFFSKQYDSFYTSEHAAGFRHRVPGQSEKMSVLHSTALSRILEQNKKFQDYCQRWCGRSSGTPRMLGVSYLLSISCSAMLNILLLWEPMQAFKIMGINSINRFFTFHVFWLKSGSAGFTVEFFVTQDSSQEHTFSRFLYHDSVFKQGNLGNYIFLIADSQCRMEVHHVVIAFP